MFLEKSTFFSKKSTNLFVFVKNGAILYTETERKGEKSPA
jgi:hypothetical protein